MRLSPNYRLPSCIILGHDHWSAMRTRSTTVSAFPVEEGVDLFHSNDIVALGRAANQMGERPERNFATTTSIGTSIHERLCHRLPALPGRIRAKSRGKGRYTMQLEQVFHFAEQEYTDSLTEFHIVGGPEPRPAVRLLLEPAAWLEDRFPSVHLKAFTMSSWTLRQITQSRSSGSSNSCEKRAWAVVRAEAPRSSPSGASADCRPQDFRSAMARSGAGAGTRRGVARTPQCCTAIIENIGQKRVDSPGAAARAAG